MLSPTRLVAVTIVAAAALFGAGEAPLAAEGPFVTEPAPRRVVKRRAVRVADGVVRRCVVNSAYPFCVVAYPSDYGPFYPYRTYYFRYPYYAAPFQTGFWWW